MTMNASVPDRSGSAEDSRRISGKRLHRPEKAALGFRMDWRRLRAFASDAQPVAKGGQVVELFEFLRVSNPRDARPVDPGRAQARPRRTAHVGIGMIAGVHHRRWRGAQCRTSRVEDSRIGLGHTGDRRRHNLIEIFTDTGTPNIRIAIGQRNQRVSACQSLKSFGYFGIQRHFAASFEKHVQGRSRESGILAMQRKRPLHCLQTQRGEVMRNMRELCSQTSAKLRELNRRQRRSNRRRMGLEPGMQLRLGRLKRRARGPQRVIEIERYRLDGLRSQAIAAHRDLQRRSCAGFEWPANRLQGSRR